MEEHQNKLNGICRLCRKAIKLGQRYVNKKVKDSYKTEILRLFNYDIENDVAAIHPKYICDNCRRKLDMVKKNSQLREVVETEIAPFEVHSNNCRLCMKHTRLNEHHFLVKYKSNITEQETPHLDLPTEEFSIHEIIAYAKTQNMIKTMEDDMSLTLSSIKAYDGKPVIDFSIKIYKEDFSWEIFVFHKTISKHLTYISRLPSYINRSNLQSFFDFYLEFHICPGNSDFPEVIKNKFAHGTDLNFHDKQKNVKAKIENKIFSTVEELDTIRTINCEVFIPKSDSRCGPCQVFRKHLTTMTHRADKEKSKSSGKYIPNKYMPRVDLEKKTQQLQKDVRFLNQQKKRNEAKIEKLFRSNKVSLSRDIDEKLNDILMSSKSGFDPNSPKHLFWEQQRKQCQLKSKKSMRWHPLMIRWCLSIYLKSPG